MMDDRRLVRTLFAAALSAVGPGAVLGPYLGRVREVFRAGAFRQLVVAGFGKASIPMARAVEETLGDLLFSGLVITPHRSPPMARGELETIDVAFAGHPHPDDAGVAATRRIMELAEGCDGETLLLLLISGGGSALLVAPAEGISLDEKQLTARLLMEAGADIHELNTVRKHLSAVKGGQLARLAHPARIVSLLISDVPGDRPDVVASGPAVADPTTFDDALAVLERRGLLFSVPANVRSRLEQGRAGAFPETPKQGDPLFDTVATTIAACNRDALEAAAGAARTLGLEVHIDSEPVTGEAAEAGRRLAAQALRVRQGLASGGRICLLSGGETTVTVRGTGMGGRNQELALAFAGAIAGQPGITLLAAGTDGIDGPTDAAGAIVDGGTIACARHAGLDPAASLKANDSHTLLERCGALLKTGPTGTNVMDVQIMIVNR
jgi:hydroxypyruvate reductase/glycerate 2-kinase